MELPIRVQLLELLNAFCTGMALGLAYDLLRPLRRGPWTRALTDLLYCLLTLLSLLAFTLYHGRGRLRLFAVFGILGGMGAWLWAWSPLFRRIQDFCIRLICRPFRGLGAVCRKICKKILKKRRKPVAIAEKHGKINDRCLMGGNARKSV